jgi:hypothetical protein
MQRRVLTTAAMLATAMGPACAEVWMVKGSSILGCRDSQALVELDAVPPANLAPRADAAKGCVVLYSGQRLLEQPQLGGGFSKYLRVEREDGSMVFVRAADVVSDPGIGSVSEDRASP